MDDPRPPLYEQLAARIPRIPATWLLIIANLLVFAAMLGQGAGLRHTDNAVQLAWGANFGPATKDGEWWRLGSALFLHFGLMHLALNMLSLWDGGRLVERMYGHGRFLVLFFAAGLAGNLLSLIAQGDRAISGGASGAVFGVYGALLSFLWLERRQLHPGEFRRLFVGAALFSAINIGLGFQVTGIDNAAHIGGFVAGILAGAALAPSLAPDPGRRRRWRLLPAVILVLAVAGLAANIPAPRYRWSEEQQARGQIGQFLGADARLSARWGAILGQARREGGSFDELAGRLEAEVSSPYEDSFEQLARLHLSPAAPSAPALAALREYAEIRRDAARALVDALRAHDPERAREALEMAREAPRRAAVQQAPASAPAR